MSMEILSQVVITDVHSVSHLYTFEGTKQKKNGRSRWGIILKYEGETVYTCGGKTFLSNSHHALILPKGCSYEWCCTKSGHFFILEFESDQVYDEPISLPLKNRERLLKSLRELEYKRSLRGFMFESECIRDTYSILLSVAQASFEKYVPNHKQKRIQPAVDYILQNYDKNIKNDTLAAVAGMSTVYFRKQFTEILGISPIAYTKQLRIEKAKEMLKSDYGALTDIAQALGYSSLYDFSRDFKKHVGVSPSKYMDR